MADAKIQELHIFIESLQSEYLEFREQSKEYETALEQELQESESKYQKLLDKNEKLESELQDLKQKYQKNEAEIVRQHKEIDNMRKMLKKYDDQKRELEHLNDQWENSTRILEYSKQDLEERLYQAEESVIMYKEELDEINNTKEAELQRLRDEVKDLKHEINVLVLQHGDINRINELEVQLKNAMKEQENLKTQLDQSKTPENYCTTVSVFAKIRPILSNDIFKPLGLSSNFDTITILPSKDKGKPQIPQKSFQFEKVYGINHKVDDIFKDFSNNINFYISGGSCCILSYGQTGSGKTYTMNYLISTTLDMLASSLSNDAKISLHCIEVYNEQVRNLLNEGPLSRNWKDIVSISEVQFQNNWHKSIKNLIALASTKRLTKSTDCNEYSSRSHCIYTFSLDVLGKKSSLQFVDLAGSERISKSMVTGDTLKETLHINKSLSALQDVISALESKSSHVPYRNSILTRLLKISLASQQCKVTVLLNVSPTEDNVNETLATLALGIRLKSIDLSWAIRKNLKSEEVERTLDLLEKERSEKNLLSRRVEKLERDVEGYAVAVKDKDFKLAQLTAKVKGAEKNYCDEIETLKKEIVALKAKIEETNKKYLVARSKIEEKNVKNQTERKLKIKVTKDLGTVSKTPFNRDLNKTVTLETLKIKKGVSPSDYIKSTTNFSRTAKPVTPCPVAVYLKDMESNTTASKNNIDSSPTKLAIKKKVASKIPNLAATYTNLKLT